MPKDCDFGKIDRHALQLEFLVDNVEAPQREAPEHVEVSLLLQCM